MGSWGHDNDIRDLCIQSPFGATDIVPIYSGTNRDDRGVTGQSILDYVSANTAAALAMVTQPFQPATGTTVTVSQVNGISVPVWVKLTPVVALAALTLAFPPAGTAVDRQEILVNSTQVITTLTVTSAGLTVSAGIPATLAQYASFRAKFDAADGVWYRIAQ